MKKCSAPNCELDILSPVSDEFCVLHIPQRSPEYNNLFWDTLFQWIGKVNGVIENINFSNFTLDNAKAGSLEANFNLKKLEFIDCSFDEFTMYNFRVIPSISFTKCVFNKNVNIDKVKETSLKFDQCQFMNEILITNSPIKNLLIVDSDINTSLKLSDCKIPIVEINRCDIAKQIFQSFDSDSISISDTTITNLIFNKNEITLTKFKNNIIKFIEMKDNHTTDAGFNNNDIGVWLCENTKFKNTLTLFQGKVAQFIIGKSQHGYMSISSIPNIQLDMAYCKANQFMISDSEIYGSLRESSFENGLKLKNTIILKQTIFENITVSRLFELNSLSVNSNCIMTFDNIITETNTQSIISLFHLGTNAKVIFDKCLFQPFITQFSENTDIDYSSYISLKHCDLKNIFFSTNYISAFSFYESYFDEAFFTFNQWNDVREILFWKMPYIRRNILCEEKGDSIPKSFFSKATSSSGEIASLYRRFKNIYDKQKDYEVAGWFYFNEFEIIRKDLAANYHDLPFFKSKLKSKLFLYTCYKIFAGYGEKPLWSFLWFVFFTVLFTFLNLFNGFNVNAKVINYDIDISKYKILFDNSFWKDLLNSGLYSIYRVLPLNYLPFSKDQFSTFGTSGIILSLVNTIILIVLLTLTFIGLKRIFRRF